MGEKGTWTPGIPLTGNTGSDIGECSLLRLLKETGGPGQGSTYAWSPTQPLGQEEKLSNVKSNENERNTSMFLNPKMITFPLSVE